MESKYEQLVKALRHCNGPSFLTCQECQYSNDMLTCVYRMLRDAAAAIEALQAEVERLHGKLCDWCAVCPKERRNPDDCELLGENPVMYVPSGAKMEVQE